VEANHKLAGNFTVDLKELAGDVARQDEARAGELKYVTIAEEKRERYKELLAGQDPERLRRIEKEEAGGEDFSGMDIPGLNLRRGGGGGGGKKKKKGKGKK
jgi:hypothetical protein